MRARFINQNMFMVLVNIRNKLLYARTWYFRSVFGMDIAKDVRISLKARIDKTNPKGLTIGEKTMVTFDAIILSHDYASRRHAAKTVIGSHCFIGCGAIVLPNITVGNHCIVAAGSVVTRDVPDNCIVAGNPAKIIKTEIDTVAYGMLTEDYLAIPNVEPNTEPNAEPNAELNPEKKQQTPDEIVENKIKSKAKNDTYNDTNNGVENEPA